MWSRLQCFIVGGLVCGVYALAVALFLHNPFWFLLLGAFCMGYFLVVIFLVFFFNLCGLRFKDL